MLAEPHDALRWRTTAGIFERLFGDSDSTDAAARKARIWSGAAASSISHRERSDLQRRSDAATGARLTAYLDSVRDVEEGFSEKKRQRHPDPGRRAPPAHSGVVRGRRQGVV